MPHRPDYSGNQRRGGKAVVFRQLGNQEAAPSDFFSQGAGAAAHHSGGGREEKIQPHRNRRRHGTKPKALRHPGDKLSIVKTAGMSQPDRRVGDGRIEQGNAVAHDLVTGCAPLPSQCSQVAAMKFAGKHGGHGRRPHQAQHVRSIRGIQVP